MGGWGLGVGGFCKQAFGASSGPTRVLVSFSFKLYTVTKDFFHSLCPDLQEKP